MSIERQSVQRTSLRSEVDRSGQSLVTGSETARTWEGEQRKYVRTGPHSFHSIDYGSQKITYYQVKDGAVFVLREVTMENSHSVPSRSFYEEYLQNRF
jgi:hypothetical protein